MDQDDSYALLYLFQSMPAEGKSKREPAQTGFGSPGHGTCDFSQKLDASANGAVLVLNVYLCPPFPAVHPSVPISG
jgi:hypothetical protein